MERGWLLGATARYKAAAVRIPGYPERMRVYRVSAEIFGEDGNDGE
jgi:hypothetical protein